jgi:hypothetical protein
VFHLQNLAALVLFFLAAGAAAIVRNWLVLSGFLLALATVKPDISGLMILWFVLWSIARWSERKRLVCSFAGTMAVLILAAEWASPHWIARFLSAVREYPTYGADPSVLRLFLPSFVAKVVAIALVCALCALCWHWRKASPGSEDFTWALAWVSAVTMAILPKQAWYNQLLLIPALVVLLARRSRFGVAGFLPRSFTAAAFGCVLWQWITAIILSLFSVFIPLARLRSAALLPEYTLFSLSALAVLAVIAATFSRWRTLGVL